MAILAKQTNRQNSAAGNSPSALQSPMSSPDSDEFARWQDAAARYIKEVYIHEAVPGGWKRNQVMVGLVMWARACPFDHKKHVAIYPHKNGGKLKKTFTNRLNKLFRTLVKDKKSKPQPLDWQDFKYKFGDKHIFEIYLANFDYYKIDRPYDTAGGFSNLIRGVVAILLELLDPFNKAPNPLGFLSFREFAGDFKLTNKIDEDTLRTVIRYLVNKGY